MEQTAFFAYDTLCSVMLEPPAGADAGALLAGAEALAMEVERTLSMFDAGSELARLCAGYTPGVAMAVSPMLRDFLRLNLDFAAITDGAFDFTVGPLVKLWNFLADDAAPPDDAALAEALGRVGWQNVHLNDEAATLTLDVPGMVLDPGASGKGFALSLVADHLRGAGVKQAVLDFGGNLYAIGGKRTEDGTEAPWRTGLRHPDKLDAVLGTVELCGRGVATSSWYEHCFKRDGVTYHHLLDPATGRPKPLEVSSVSILSSQAVYTDLMSTAFFILGPGKGAALAKRLWEERGVDVDWVAMLPGGEVKASPGAGFAAFTE